MGNCPTKFEADKAHTDLNFLKSIEQKRWKACFDAPPVFSAIPCDTARNTSKDINYISGLIEEWNANDCEFS